MQFANTCPQCKAEKPKGSRFCPRCGYAYNGLLAKTGTESPSMPPIPTRTVRPKHPEAQRAVQPHYTPAQKEVKEKEGASSALPGFIRPIEIAEMSPERAVAKKQSVVEQQTQQILASQSKDQQPAPQSQPMQQHSPIINTPPPLDNQPPEMITTQPGMNPWQQGAEKYSPSLAATHQAANHWRTSWRDRQHAEAGPATEISRGQSAVPEPLMAMQDSLMRIRTIILPGKADEHRSQMRFWCSLLLILGLMSLSWAYIFSTFSSNNSGIPAVTHSQVRTTPPHLTVTNLQSATIAQGQALHLHGEYFGAGDTILFVLDGSHTLNSTNGKELSATVSDFGTFDVTLTITPAWTPGLHILSANDQKIGQSAYLNVQIRR